MLTVLSPDTLTFPPVDEALTEPNGLLAIGGDLRPERLLAAYRHGIFPWYSDPDPLLWWSPDPRMVLEPGDFHVSRSLKRTWRRHAFRVTVDRDFDAVIRACADSRAHREGTWITPAMQRAYHALHERGVAHSVEVWDGGRLAGGLYGLALGRWFFGESMFSAVPDSSKTALCCLHDWLTDAGFVGIDCQVGTPHLARLGGHWITRTVFTQRLAACDDPSPIDHWPRDLSGYLRGRLTGELT